MSGHSKWSGIKHKKAVVDAKKGMIFSKIIREITIAARDSGGDPGKNSRLRMAMEKAKTANMPADNIKKAILRGTGEMPGVTYEETTYEGYGPGGIAVLVDAVTDNKNRTASEIRKTFSKHGGNLGEVGCVGWMFSKKGYISVGRDVPENKLMEIVLDAGAEDLKTDDEDIYEVLTDTDSFNRVKDSIEKNSITVNSAEITMLPKTYIKLKGKQAQQMLALMSELEENDDVQNAYANFDIPKEIMEEASK